MNLNLLWALDDDRIENIDYTFCNFSNDSATFSTIDHFAVGSRMIDGIVSAGVIHDSANLSGHSAIFSKFNCGKMYLGLNHLTKTSRVSWNKANCDEIIEFKRMLEEKLKTIDYNHECTDIKCDSDMHSEQLEDFTIEVLQAMEESGR